MANFDNIIQEINTNLPDNITQAITAAKLRTTLIDLTNQIDTVQDDFETDVNEAINDISNSVTDLSNSIRIETQFPFEFGSVSTYTGGLISNTVRVRTPKFSVNDTGSNTVLANFDNSITKFTIGCFYNGDNFVRAVNSAEIQTNYVDGTITITPDQSLTSGFDSVILVFGKYNLSAEITQSELDNCYLIEYTQMKDVVNSNTTDITEIQGDITEIQGDITEIQGDITEIQGDITEIQGDIYIEEHIPFEYGGMSSGGALNSSIKRCRNQRIQISGDAGVRTFNIHLFENPVKYNCYGYNGETPVENITSSVSYSGGVLTLNYSGNYDNFIVTFGFSGSTSSPDITATELAECYQIVMMPLVEQVQENTQDIITLQGQVQELENGASGYYGLKYCALGDSITYGFIPRNYTGYPGQLDSYAKLAAQKLGMTFVNNGISGSTLAVSNPDNPSTRNPMVLRYIDCPDDADVISVMGGTNDIRNGVQLGTMSDRVNTTYYGALHILLGGLYKKYCIDQGTTAGKTKKIFICTPPKLLASSGNVDGGTGTLVNMDSWCDAIKEVAAYYSIPVLDFQNLSGINPHLNQTIHGTDEGYTAWYNPYITDGTHPTQEGAEIMANVLVGFLKGLK